MENIYQKRSFIQLQFRQEEQGIFFSFSKQKANKEGLCLNVILYSEIIRFHYQKDISMKLIILSIAIAIASCNLTYKKVLLTDADAKCLDGSQGAYYIWPGDPKKVLLFFEGGGWCGSDDLSSTIENCYQRSKTDLGSSTGYRQTQTFGEGILSDDKDNYFNGWTRIFLKYCDGTGHQGTRSDPILYKGATLYFRGQNVTLSQLASVEKSYGIFSGSVSHLVLTGQSAGGLATFHWTNYFEQKRSKNTKFWSIPDSGVFVDVPNKNSGKNEYRNWLDNIVKIANEEVGTPVKQCNIDHKNQLWKCMFAQYLHPYITAPIFTPQSLYDTWSLYNIVGLRCVNSFSQCNEVEKSAAESYHRATLQVMFEIASSNNNGVWAPVCLNHCYLSNLYYSNENYRIPSGSEFSLMESVRKWIQNEDDTTRHIDFGNWPSNTPCSGLLKQ